MLRKEKGIIAKNCHVNGMIQNHLQLYYKYTKYKVSYMQTSNNCVPQSTLCDKKFKRKFSKN